MKPSVFQPGIIRQKVRSALKARKARGLTEAVLLEFVNGLLGGGVTLQEIRDALEFNHSEAFIRSSYNKSTEETVWIITDAGVNEDI